MGTHFERQRNLTLLDSLHRDILLNSTTIYYISTSSYSSLFRSTPVNFNFDSSYLTLLHFTSSHTLTFASARRCFSSRSYFCTDSSQHQRRNQCTVWWRCQ